MFSKYRSTSVVVELFRLVFTFKSQVLSSKSEVLFSLVELILDVFPSLGLRYLLAVWSAFV